MRAIVSGCGIAGPVAAMALQRVGIEAIVYERRPERIGKEGLFLSLASNGLRVLEDLGLAAPLLKADVIPTPNMVILSSMGRELANISMGRLASGSKPLTVMRQTMRDVLANEALSRGIDIRFGEAVTDYRSTPTGVSVQLSDQSEAYGDVLIAADGINSSIRRRMNHGRTLERYTGLINLGGIVKQSELTPTLDKMRMIWGRRAFFGYTVRSSGEAWWYANLGRSSDSLGKSIERTNPGQWKTELLELFQYEPSFVCDLIRASSQISAFPIYDVPNVPRWVDGRALLIGDAAHAASPSSGQGASLAMEDAAYLAVSLRDIEDPVRALKHFEEQRRPRAERIVANGRRRSSYKAPKNFVSMWLRDRLVPLALRVFANDEALSWIYDYRIPSNADAR